MINTESSYQISSHTDTEITLLLMMNLYPILIASLWPALVLSIYPYRLNDNIPSVSYLNTPQGKGDERAMDRRA